MITYVDTTSSLRLEGLNRTITFTQELRDALKKYIQSPSNMSMGSSASPTPVFRLADSLTSLEELAKSNDRTQHQNLLETLLQQLPSNSFPNTRRVVPEPKGFTSIAPDYHLDLYPSAIKQGQQFYLCIVTTDPEATTEYLPDPMPILKCNQNYDLTALAYSDICEHFVVSQMHPKLAIEITKSLLLHISTQALKSMVTDSTVQKKQLEPNTLYRMGDTIHISPTTSPTKQNSPRLLFALFTKTESQLEIPHNHYQRYL
jgi:hypothetical protein